MGVSELETVARLGLPMVVVVYDDAAYGAEVHHFGPDGYRARRRFGFPPADIAAIGRGFGFDGVTVRGAGGPGAGARLAGRPAGRGRCVIDAKVTVGARLVVAGGGLPRALTP